MLSRAVERPLHVTPFGALRLAPLLAAVAAAITLGLTGPAHALSSTLTFELTSIEVDRINSYLQVGDPIQVTIRHSDCTDACAEYYGADSIAGYYFDLDVFVDVTLSSFAGSYLIQARGSDPMQDLYDFSVLNYSEFDRYEVSAYQAGGVTITPAPVRISGSGRIREVLGGAAVTELRLTDLDATVFDSGFVPPALPPLDEFEEQYFRFGLALDYIDINGVLHSETVFFATAVVVPVPEPSSAILIGTGLAVALAAQRRAARPARCA